MSQSNSVSSKIRKFYAEHGIDTPTEEVLTQIGAEITKANKQMVYNVRNFLKRNSGKVVNPGLTITTLRKIKDFIAIIGGISVLEEGIALLKEFARQEDFYKS